ncbi:DUF2956 family protein [Marinimicrobium sp. ABcell2]|uniref:DUF2956 family protein n=1 Tax=Marinimicrobium sp. ABcell2 TaxID=3069751 RepID=UPI0027AE048A|nr:DUF2956 family protein [Marinimicrobium sp. ABcell2]MDQ2075687.1 DUF2956 family protein [Marinimicrobium sp. ABcell2]
MAKDKKASRDLKSEAAKIVRAVNAQGESRAETQRINAAVQRAMEHHLRQHSAKARELDKKAKKVQRLQASDDTATDDSIANVTEPGVAPGARLPWALLAVSWILFAAYFLWG